MAGRKPRTPAPAAAPMSAGGSDDEVPEEFSQASAARQAQEQRARERQAREAARSASKRKRQPRKEEKAADEEQEVEQLPEDVLAAVAAAHETDAAEAQAEEARARQQQRRERLKKQKTHVRRFGPVEARTLASAVAADAASRKLSPSAEQFLARRAAPHRPRAHVLEGHKSLFTKQQKQRSQQQQQEGVSA